MESETRLWGRTGHVGFEYHIPAEVNVYVRQLDVYVQNDRVSCFFSNDAHRGNSDSSSTWGECSTPQVG